MCDQFKPLAMDSVMSWKRLIPLMILVALYLCLGALIFKHLEGDPEIQRRQDLKEMIRTFIGKYLMIISDFLFIIHLSVLATFELETISFDKDQV